MPPLVPRLAPHVVFSLVYHLPVDAELVAVHFAHELEGSDHRLSQVKVWCVVHSFFCVTQKWVQTLIPNR